MKMLLNSLRQGAANRRQHSLGFTLIELMVTVAIIGILASIAYPSYQQHIIRTYRSSAKACLMQYAQFLERSRTSDLATGYDVADPVLGCTTEGKLNQRYTIAIDGDATTATTFRVTATPTAQQSDAVCGTLSIEQTGALGETGTGAVTDCW